MRPVVHAFLVSVVFALAAHAQNDVFSAPLNWNAITGSTAGYASNLRNLPTTKRASLVMIAGGAIPLDPQKLNLFSDRILIATRVRIERRSPTDYSWFGNVVAPSPGSATIVIRSGRLTASIQMGKEFFAIDPIGQGYHVIREIDATKYPPDEPRRGRWDISGPIDSVPNTLMISRGAQQAASWSCPPVIRVLVAYTPGALQQQFDLPARIQAAVDEAQQAYVNSGLVQRIELAGTIPTIYTENASFAKDLDNFTGHNDGQMDEIHTRRADTASDVAVLITNNGGACGLAHFAPVDASRAFGAVWWSCLSPGRYSFAHELGHIQSARHNPEADPDNTPHDYVHGYRNDSAGWRDIMSYDCATPCPRIPYFANPNVLYNGIPTGKLPLSHASRALDDTAEKVADFVKHCDHAGNPSDHSTNSRGPALRVYTAGPETLIAAGSTLYKIDGAGGTGQNMFALTSQGTSLPGYTYWLGSQSFPAPIADVVYTNGQTLVGLTDGRIVKVNGTGGLGLSMFAINVHPNGFTGMSGFPHYIGSHRFQSAIVDMSAQWGELLISFANGKLLKVSATGGGGFNLMAVNETSTGFSSVPGYAYYIGDTRFSSPAINMTPIGNEMLFSFSNGKILKTRWTGGTGHNMLAVSETTGGFNGLSGYNHYLGDAKFSASVTDVVTYGSQTLLAFSNGKMLKINGTGGTGHNMFAVNETSGGFDGISGYGYYIGDAKFSAPVLDVLVKDGSTLVGLGNGKMLKVMGSGGTGHNMFAVTEVSNGFDSVPGYSYLQGSSTFGSAVTGLAEANEGSMFVSLANGKMFKAKNTGGTGYNLFGVVQTSSAFRPLCCYDYWTGSY